MARSKSLGRGLDALLGSNEKEYAAVKIASKNGGEGGAVTPHAISVKMLVPNTYQPRKNFDDEKAKDLVNSIREKGILQPILIRPIQDSNSYEIIAGERRWRAAKIVGLSEIPVIIRDFNDEEALEIALIENIQRHDLTPIEEAMGYKRLMEEFSHTQEQLGLVVGKSRSHIANILRLLLLPAAVQEMLAEGKITMGHARALITADNAVSLALKIVKQGLSVRQTEMLVKGITASTETKAKPKKASKKPLDKDPDTLALEQELTTSLGFPVTVEFSDEEMGEIRISYKNLEQLDDICQRLS